MEKKIQDFKSHNLGNHQRAHFSVFPGRHTSAPNQQRMVKDDFTTSPAYIHSHAYTHTYKHIHFEVLQ